MKLVEAIARGDWSILWEPWAIAPSDHRRRRHLGVGVGGNLSDLKNHRHHNRLAGERGRGDSGAGFESAQRTSLYLNVEHRMPTVYLNRRTLPLVTGGVSFCRERPYEISGSDY